MYLKNLVYHLNIRLSDKDADFVKMLSDKAGMSFSQVIRGIIENYRLRYFDEYSFDNDKNE